MNMCILTVGKHLRTTKLSRPEDGHFASNHTIPRVDQNLCVWFLNELIDLACNTVGSGGLIVRAPACRSRGRWFDSTSAVSKLGQFRSPNFARVFRKRH